MPNLRAMNFYIKGVLEPALRRTTVSTSKPNTGEYLRAKYIEVPQVLAARNRSGVVPLCAHAHYM